MRSEPMKEIVELERGAPVHWVGDGFRVRTLLSYDRRPRLASPFLLLDYAAPHVFDPSPNRRGVGLHPHRGFETVTIVYDGEVEHRDSSGATGKVGPGDVQWMTAGRGVLHEERHSQEFSLAGGTMEMAQLWVKLPREVEMSSARYQDLRRGEIPTVELPGDAGAVRVIAGEFLGVEGPARTWSPVQVLDLELLGRGSLDLDLPHGHTAILLVRRGCVGVGGGDTLGSAELALFGQAGGRLRLEVPEEARALLLTGAPLAEPVFGQGPFVLSTKEGLVRAFEDFRDGTFLGEG